MELDFDPAPRLSLYGYSPETPESILARIASGARPSSLKGDFVLVAEGQEARTGRPLMVFISSLIAAVPHYIARAGAHWVHASTVFECCQKAGLPWRWNWDALAQLVLFEHVLGNASLHADIERVPARSVLRLCGAKRDVVTEAFWSELHAERRLRALPTDAAEVLLEVLGELPALNRYSLSLSAGYDSRLLLAGLTRLRREVTTACMGSPGATDPRIAAQLAQAMGCRFQRVEIEPADYLRHADDIVRTTSGEKIFWHWHTAIYSRKVGFDSQTTHLAGSNGEFVRSYFFDKGMAAELLDLCGYSRWDRWLSLKNASRRRVAPAVRRALDPFSPFARALNARRQLEESFLRMRFGDGLDYFYAAERVRNFIGLGLALYRGSFPTMSPFLDARFIRVAAQLTRHNKLADRTPRALIAKLQPSLLEFPADDSGRPMGQQPAAFFFLRKPTSHAYQRHREAHDLPEVAEWARDGFEVLNGEAPGSGTELDAEVHHWDHAITVGATARMIRTLGIPLG